MLAANRRFYEAFENRDMDAMSDLWERSPRCSCTHPGWATLRGWGPIAASFFALFRDGEVQFLLTDERAEVVGDTAWVSVDENLLGDQGGATISALNIFIRAGDVARDHEHGDWRLVCHHGSIVNQAMNVSG
ncbi:MAG: nuclear transport factor 2 family protein [Acidimicrobiales bacterium]